MDHLPDTFFPTQAGGPVPAGILDYLHLYERDRVTVPIILSVLIGRLLSGTATEQERATVTKMLGHHRSDITETEAAGIYWPVYYAAEREASQWLVNHGMPPIGWDDESVIYMWEGLTRVFRLDKGFPSEIARREFMHQVLQKWAEFRVETVDVNTDLIPSHNDLEIEVTDGVILI